MRPYDKFGNVLYESVYNEILKNGQILIQNGFIESINKPNLFYKKIKDIMIFADLRGTEEVKIWEDTRPMIFIDEKSKNNYPSWMLRKILKEECQNLNDDGCPTRFSFYSECEPDGLMFYEEDGFCKECGKDFQDNGLYCSKECETIARKKKLAQYINSQPFCTVCNKRIIESYQDGEIKELLNEELSKNYTLHHTSYENDQTIPVCSSCHSKIHHSNKPSLKKYLPESKRPKKESNYYTTCEQCGGKTKKDNNVEHQICNKCKHKCIKCGEFTQCFGKICYSCQKKEWNKKNTKRIFRYDPMTGKSSID